MMFGSLYQQAWFLIRYYQENAWRFIATFSVLLQDKKLNYKANLNTDAQSIMRSIKAQHVRDSDSHQVKLNPTPFKVYDMLTFDINVSDPIQVIQIFEQI